MTRKSIDHIYGAQPLPSDDMRKVVGNVFMEEAAIETQIKKEELARQRAAIPKGLKSKPTVTSLLRREANR